MMNEHFDYVEVTFKDGRKLEGYLVDGNVLVSRNGNTQVTNQDEIRVIYQAMRTPELKPVKYVKLKDSPGVLEVHGIDTIEGQAVYSLEGEKGLIEPYGEKLVEKKFYNYAEVAHFLYGDKNVEIHTCTLCNKFVMHDLMEQCPDCQKLVCYECAFYDREYDTGAEIFECCMECYSARCKADREADAAMDQEEKAIPPSTPLKKIHCILDSIAELRDMNVTADAGNVKTYFDNLDYSISDEMIEAVVQLVERFEGEDSSSCSCGDVYCQGCQPATHNAANIPLEDLPF